MDGFKKNPKIACFKEGGQVGYKSRKTAECDKADIKQDKAIVKKAVGQHEASKHKGEGNTELKLKSGGRCKKEAGTVKKYKKGGEVIGMKKTAEDKKDIAGIKKKGSAPKKAAPKTKQMPAPAAGMAPAEMPVAEELPAFEEGGNVFQRAGRRIRNAVMGSPEQNAEAQARLNKYSQQEGALPAVERAISGGMGQAAPSNGMGQANPQGPISDRERELLKGVQAIGRACGGSI